MARILVVDDEEQVRRAVRLVLESAGHEVLEANDGGAGLALYRERGADLILVDIFMPGQDGLEVISALRTSGCLAKIIAMSGWGSVGYLDMLEPAEAFGASRSIRKPFDSQTLLREVRDLLAERTPPPPKGET